ncbi:alpha-2-macroglobulin [Rhodoblastus sphagnicola]|uniref:Alpha-2-macroglobulin n=1 Tax=Rhodoblastus sphagnicola TaxID=333368 RepID=A0A2S6N2D5_9HYPH|nr:alpha-2-macroglobulin [Rhodoblastus sphagnicola]MBB4197335.1 hypothetical protein [Rhodoblastus sphagnicola]PPQ28762.1 alpha-2-macroglobulin [Rhodoblastus sphagnicola]
MRPTRSLCLAVLGFFLAIASVSAAPQPQKAPATRQDPKAQALKAQAPKAYVNDDLAASGEQLAQKAQEDTRDLRHTPPLELRKQLDEAEKRGDVAQQLTLLEALAASAPDDPYGWLALARVELSASTVKDADESKFKDLALAAAWLSYQKARAPGDEAAALTLIGQIQANRESWREALNATAAALKAQDNPDLRKTYEDMREKHGFRVLKYTVDNESANPRACFQFSEDLLRSRTDFSPFVTVGGQDSPAISQESQQICVENLVHGEHYAVTLRAGLPSQVGEDLLHPLNYDLYIRDRSPSAHFTGRNYVLPRVGPEGLPIVSVNTRKIKVEIYRVGDRNLLPTVRSEDFLSQLSGYRLKQFANSDGEKIWSGTLDAQSEANKDVVTDLPVLEILKTPQPGVYVMSAQAADDLSTSDDSYDTKATQWFVVSDLGLTALSAPDGVTVLVRSLADASPKPGVEVRLLAKNNEPLATATTDAQGAVRFDPGLSRGEGGLAPGLIVANDGKADANFLDLQQSAFDLADRGVKGRAAPAKLDAFVYAERGVYRSNENVFLTALLRDAQGAAVAQTPLTLVIKRPDGVEFLRATSPDQGLGGRALSFKLPNDAASGGWTVEAFVDPKSPALGETSFLVEDYVPERMDMTLAPKAASAKPGASVKLDVALRYLYGAPGAGLNLSGDVEISQAKDHGLPALAGFDAGMTDEDFSAVKNDIETDAATDESGKASVEVALPEAEANRPLEAKITLRAGEVGGHAIERQVYLPLLPATGLIGVKKTFGTLSDGAQATFDVIAVGPDGRRKAQPHVQWTLVRVNNDYQWYKQDGRWTFEQVNSTSKIASGTLDLAKDQPGKIAALVGLGHYRLDLRGEDPKDAQTSVSFDSGWSSEAKAPTPDLLDLTLDRQDYASGEILVAKITARADSKATLAIVSDKVHATILADLNKGENEIKIPVGADWGAGAYAVALAHRPLDKAAQRNPGRAIGVAWFGIDHKAHSLDVALKAPAKAKPREKLTIPLEIKGADEAYVTISAVDLGILNLTRYQTPNPRDYFYGQKILAAEVRDLYGLLIDGLQGTRGAIHSGGDSGGPEAGVEKPTQEPLALYSGLVKVGPDGKAQVSFDLPAFNGTVRLTAVAWAKKAAGSASADVIVRDPVVAQASLPRFLALKDQSRLNLRLDNVEGAGGDYRIDVRTRGGVAGDPAALHRTIKLAAKASAVLDIPLRAEKLGDGAVEVALAGPNFSATQTLPLAVQPGTSPVVRRDIRELGPGESLTLNGALLADFLPGAGAVAVSVSSLAGIDAAALLHRLDAYPFSCSEQTVSRALPLLYVNKLAQDRHVAWAQDIPARVNSAIKILLARQDSSGAFGLWSASGAEDMWLNAYVSDFLTRARETSYDVPQKAMDLALDRLRNYVVNTTEVDADKGAPLAYAIYVLARNGRPVSGDLRYLADAKLDAFTTPLARAQLAGAAALLGDKARAKKIFVAAAEALNGARPSQYSRPDFGSSLRDGAGLLALGAESAADPAVLVKAARFVEGESANLQKSSTQEQSWLVLAAQATATQAQAQKITVDGVEKQGAYSARYEDAVLRAKPVTITNASDKPVRIGIDVSGRPSAPEPAETRGYSLERGLFHMDGSAADPMHLTQNERLVATLKVVESEAAFARLVLEDRLPAGLEIDNPALYDGGSSEGLDWVKAGVEPSHTEYKDDRFVASFERSGADKATFTVAYIVRAVSPGRYVQPPALIEDMYRPERFGRTGFGEVAIEAAKK